MEITFFPDRGSNPVRWTQSTTLYHVAIKAGLYCKAVQVCYIPIPGDIYINDAHWFVTFIHDLRPFKNLFNQIEVDLESTDKIIEAVIKNYKYSNLTGYMETFKSLRVEVDLLTDTYKSVYDSFDEYQTLSVKSQRIQRSLIPIIGQLMITLFGTVSEKTLKI